MHFEALILQKSCKRWFQHQIQFIIYTFVVIIFFFAFLAMRYEEYSTLWAWAFYAWYTRNRVQTMSSLLFSVVVFNKYCSSLLLSCINGCERKKKRKRKATRKHNNILYSKFHIEIAGSQTKQFVNLIWTEHTHLQFSSHFIGEESLLNVIRFQWVVLNACK